SVSLDQNRHRELIGCGKLLPNCGTLVNHAHGDALRGVIGECARFAQTGPVKLGLRRGQPVERQALFQGVRRLNGFPRNWVSLDVSSATHAAHTAAATASASGPGLGCKQESD